MQETIDGITRNAKGLLAKILFAAAALMVLPLPVLLLLKHSAAGGGGGFASLIALSLIIGEAMLFAPILMILVLAVWAMQSPDDRDQKLKDAGSLALLYAPVFLVEIAHIAYSIRSTSMYAATIVGAAVMLYAAGVRFLERRA